MVQHYLATAMSNSSNKKPPSRTSSRRSTASRHSIQDEEQDQERDRPSSRTQARGNDRDQPSPEGLKVIHIDPARIRREPKPTLRQRLFGRFGASSSRPHHDAEEGHANPREDSDDDGDEDDGYIRRANRPPAPAIVEPESILSPPASNPNLNLERTATTRSIRFTPDTAEPSDTVPAPPGRGNYGLSVPGFKRNPTLSMDRTRSYHEEEEEEEDQDESGGGGQSVSFRVPDKRR